jgi:CHASE2 domain-containing sensor protein
MKKYLFHWLSIAGTAAIFSFLGLMAVVAVNLDFLNVFEQTVSDFNLADLYFSRLRDNKSVKQDDRVVLVNFANLSRAEMAQQIEILSSFKPKVIGIDARFFKNLKPAGDSIFENALKNAGNVVLVSQFKEPKEDSLTQKSYFDTLVRPIPRFLQHVKTGHANLITEGSEAFETCRTFSPKESTKNGKVEPCFAAKLVEFYDKKAAEDFLKRDYETEKIYFRGDYDKFSILEYTDVLDTNFVAETVKDKIIIMGYMGEDYMSESWDADRFYTPMNERQVGRATPDMYGVVIHANIVSMILDRSYINSFPSWFSIGLAIVICWLNAVLFIYIYFHEKLGLWYDAITKLVQFLEIFIFVFVFMFIFADFNLFWDMGLVVATTALAGDVLEVFLAVSVNIFKRE